MDNNHEEYNQALEDYAKQRLEYVFLDISEELDNIERTLETEASKILLNWVRDSILRVSDNYKI
jgi:molecular chaperone GrpE (heat shock protein)